MSYRKTVGEYYRDGRTVQVDEVKADPLFGPSWEVWEVGQDREGRQWESCLTESGEPFEHKPTEAEVWALVEECDRVEGAPGTLVVSGVNILPQLLQTGVWSNPNSGCGALVP